MTTPAIPVLSSSDLAIQARSAAWKTHNPNDGSNIGGTMPTNYGLSHEVPGNPGAMQLFVEGPSWATMMAYTQRPLIFTQPDHIQLDFDVNVLDVNGALLETDIIVVIPAPANTPIPNTTPVQNATGIMLNMSLQDLFTKGGQLQNVMTAGAWVDIPNAKPGVLTVGSHHYTVTATWNQTKQTYGITSVTLDGTTYPVTQSAAGKPVNWSTGISLQFQITLAPLPAGTTFGATSIVVDNVNLQQFA